MSLFVHEDETCPECNNPATMCHDTSTREVWWECETPNCVYGEDVNRTLNELGYSGAASDDESEAHAALSNVLNNPPPYPCFDLERRVKWWEFLRSLKEADFAKGDQIVLNGVHFMVI